MGFTSVKMWLKHFIDGNADIADQRRCDRPRSSMTESKEQKFDTVIKDDRRMMDREMAALFDTGHQAVQEMTATLGYREVCCRSVPLLFADEYRKIRMDMSSQLL
jgi:ribosome biogenesis protein Tsr3